MAGVEKSDAAFRTISEVAEHLGTPAHVLRFWESRFPQIRPVKRAGGRRYYRPSDVALLAGIRRLLHDDGLTIRGVQKILREQGVRHVSSLSGREVPDAVEDWDAAMDVPERDRLEGTDPSPDDPDALGDSTSSEQATVVHRIGFGPKDEAEVQPPDAVDVRWLASDLRALSPQAFRDRLSDVERLAERLQALRARVADRGRIPRR